MTSRAPGPILIIEDNDETRDVLQRILSMTGYWWQSASDGPEALAYLQDETKTKPAAIVLDIHMPGMDGREVMRTMQADPRLVPFPSSSSRARPAPCRTPRRAFARDPATPMCC
jgi:CheY-like chemotaxis protein